MIELPLFQPEERHSKFNEGFYKVYRLSKLKEGCHDARLFKDINKWSICLQGIRSEINSKLTNKPKKDSKEKTERDIADEYEHAINSCVYGKKDEIIEVNGKKGKVNKINIYNVLYGYELWLEDMKEKYKMGMPEEESAMSALK